MGCRLSILSRHSSKDDVFPAKKGDALNNKLWILSLLFAIIALAIASSTDATSLSLQFPFALLLGLAILIFQCVTELRPPEFLDFPKPESSTEN
jgi:hypothetical protein